MSGTRCRYSIRMGLPSTQQALRTIKIGTELRMRKDVRRRRRRHCHLRGRKGDAHCICNQPLYCVDLAMNRISIVLFALGVSSLVGCRLRLREEIWHGPVSSNNLPQLRSLVDGGMPVDSVDENGDTPLGWALARDNKDMARYLISKGANPYHVNRRGETAIQRGQSSRPASENVAKWLSEEGLLQKQH